MSTCPRAHGVARGGLVLEEDEERRRRSGGPARLGENERGFDEQGLPTGALGEALRAASQGQALGWPVLVSALWMIGALALAWKVFKWTS